MGLPSRVDDNGQIPPAWLRVQVCVPGNKLLSPFRKRLPHPP